MNSERHLVLHGLAIKKLAPAHVVADALGMDPSEAEPILNWLAARGLVAATHGRYSLTPIGRVSLTSEYSRFCADLRRNADFIRIYAEFEIVNTTLKALITRWQVIERAGTAVANDHSDPVYDGKIISRLGDLHLRADRVLAGLAAHLPRLEIYRDKLGLALERAETGAVEWVSDVKIESYHTLWFELHEDLLCMLGRERSE